MSFARLSHSASAQRKEPWHVFYLALPCREYLLWQLTPGPRSDMATRTQLEDIERPSRAASTHVRYWILAGILIATAINYLDRANLSIAAPIVKKDLNISDVQMGLIFSAFSWTYAALQIPGGWLLERAGARKTFGFALIFWSIVTGCISLARGFGSLLGLRLALGAAGDPRPSAQQLPGQPLVPDPGTRPGHRFVHRGRVRGAGRRRPAAGLDGHDLRMAFGLLPVRRARFGLRVRLAGLYPE